MLKIFIKCSSLYFRVPLSYGDFDRQVYAAGYQKRKMFRAHDLGFTPETQVKPKKSPCVIQ